MNIVFHNGYDESRIEISETPIGYVVSIEYVITDWGTGNRLGVVERNKYSKSFIKKAYSSENLIKKDIVDYIQENIWGTNQHYSSRTDILNKLGWSE